MEDKSRDFGRELCRALGLDTGRVMGISLHSKAGMPGLVAEVRIVPSAEQQDAMEAVIEKYTLRVEHRLP